MSQGASFSHWEKGCPERRSEKARPRPMVPNWMKMLLAVLLGNLIYFAAQPFLPESARHNLYELDPGLVVDFAICLGIYLLLIKKRDKIS
jgi:zinc transporter ZupT